MGNVSSTWMKFAAIGVLITGALAAPATVAAAASPIQKSFFDYMGGPQNWTVPAGVGQVRVTASGAQGEDTNGGADRGHGGPGAVVERTFDVMPGDVLRIRVGGQGGHWGVGSAGWNGGGHGGAQGGPAGNDGGGGGGASDVSLQHGSDWWFYVIAGGGGGGGGNQAAIRPDGFGGGGGDASMTNRPAFAAGGGGWPVSPFCGFVVPGLGGQGGHDGEGGLPSTGLRCGGGVGRTGSAGGNGAGANGGNGAGAEPAVGGGGGGGGGGFGGGGGGGAPDWQGGGGDGGGGGGSLGDLVLPIQNYRDGQVEIDYIVGAPISMAMATSPTPLIYGQPLVANARLTPAPQGGTVQFALDGKNIGSPVGVDATGMAAAAPITSLSVGAHTLGAHFSGITDFSTGTSTAPAQITQTLVVQPDTDPPVITVSAPAVPTGHNGYFNINDLATAGGRITVAVSGSDTSGTVTTLACTDNGSTAPIAGESGTNPRTATLAVSANGTHAIACTGTDSAGNSGNNGGQNTATVRIDTTAPTLTVPASPVPVDATGPAGARVTSYPVSATDPDAADAPSITCSPALPYTFAVGDAPVMCIATDQAGNPTSAQSFTVHIKGAGEQLTDLAVAVAGVVPGGSLSSKVATALQSLSRADTTATCGQLAAFVNEVNAQKGNQIPATQAEQLTADAMRIQAVVDCP